MLDASMLEPRNVMSHLISLLFNFLVPCLNENEWDKIF